MGGSALGTVSLGMHQGSLRTLETAMVKTPKLKVLKRWPADPQYKLNSTKWSRNILAYSPEVKVHTADHSYEKSQWQGPCALVLYHHFRGGPRERISVYTAWTNHRSTAVCSMFKDDEGRGDARYIRSYPYVTAAGWLSLSLSVKPVVRAGVVVSATLFLESAWFYSIAT